MSRVSSFPPLAGPAARVLVLGSMPGTASLNANQYYAHPRNAFWSIVDALFAIDRSLAYAERCAALVGHGVAVWDVLRSCHRPGSLDADIDPRSIVVNDFAGFFASHPAVCKLCFNGATAERLFKRHVAPSIADREGLVMIRLPSTSPAHAAMRLDDKIAHWRQALVQP
ncbi:MAG: DNA-deoxyinosine glycosylase [Gammaproteobacteria bacterium]|nr:DNA-deoxyinosine glycosylase [Gammaproteobacteria bacterium]